MVIGKVAFQSAQCSKIDWTLGVALSTHIMASCSGLTT